MTDNNDKDHIPEGLRFVLSVTTPWGERPLGSISLPKTLEDGKLLAPVELDPIVTKGNAGRTAAVAAELLAQALRASGRHEAGDMAFLGGRLDSVGRLVEEEQS
ncbi:hypothetical protein OZX67_03965 [Bifidobacterium sp. ESL0728]|uniref:hypothetical protein n=1 Tax=Bifidobacterium sp. ESL0728 TaxID=2983220 RepID=UPI0023F96C00|nr:hypothetical protein [Bifidobacterium sp. ESL0728]WEV59704.1 hypothetical protein OZX67_03965 [Bifidobacterium sp. ESL0728]